MDPNPAEYWHIVPLYSDVEEGEDEVEGRSEELYRQFLNRRLEREPSYHNPHHLENQVQVLEGARRSS